MVLKTFDTILTELCNYFDTAISPTKIARANTNVIYLVLKSFSKGLEVIHNLVVSLRNKFDPENCEEEDLESLAKLVGTSKYAGSASGLVIIITNTGKKLETLPAGRYTYMLSEEAKFFFINSLDLVIPAEEENKVSFVAMSTDLKPIYVTEQANISLEGKTEAGETIEIPSRLQISCEDNSGLQGALPEDNLAFRERIIKGTSTETLLNKMEVEINNLPYIYSCRILFNNSTSPASITYPGGSVSVDPYKMLVILSGAPEEKVAEIVASYGVYETMAVPGKAKYIDYNDPIFIEGHYRVNYMEPIVLNYKLAVYYEIDLKSISNAIAQQKMTEALAKYKLTNTYMPLITEREFSNLLANLGINTLQILNVDLMVGKEDTVVDYLKVSKINIARLTDIEFHPVM